MHVLQWPVYRRCKTQLQGIGWRKLVNVCFCIDIGLLIKLQDTALNYLPAEHELG
jgi:hypothetical protein